MPRNGCRVSYRHENPKYDTENIKNVTCYRWQQLLLGLDCRLFEGENEMVGEAANWRRLRTEERGNGFRLQFDTDLAPSNATG